MPTLAPDRDGLNVFNVRVYTAPFPSVPDLSLEFEYASERERRCARFQRVDAPGGVRARRRPLDADALVSLCVFPGR